MRGSSRIWQTFFSSSLILVTLAAMPNYCLAQQQGVVRFINKTDLEVTIKPDYSVDSSGKKRGFSLNQLTIGPRKSANLKRFESLFSNVDVEAREVGFAIETKYGIAPGPGRIWVAKYKNGPFLEFEIGTIHIVNKPKVAEVRISNITPLHLRINISSYMDEKGRRHELKLSKTLTPRSEWTPLKDGVPLNASSINFSASAPQGTTQLSENDIFVPKNNDLTFGKPILSTFVSLDNLKGISDLPIVLKNNSSQDVVVELKTYWAADGRGHSEGSKYNARAGRTFEIKNANGDVHKAIAATFIVRPKKGDGEFPGDAMRVENGKLIFEITDDFLNDEGLPIK